MGATPPLPLWVDDWLTSEAIDDLSPRAERGYMRLLMWCWKGDGCSLPTDRDKLARMAKMTRARPELELILELFFGSHPSRVDRITNPKLLQLWLDGREREQKLSNNGRKAAEARWQTQCGRNADAYADAMPSPSPSPSPSRKDTRARDPHPTTPEPTKRTRWVPTPEQEERCKALSRGLLRHRGIRRDIIPNAKVCGYLDCAAHDGRTQAEACALLEAYPSLDDPKLREAGWPPALFQHRLTALLARGVAPAGDDAEAIQRVLVAIGEAT